ncbi:MAG: hypothetical protein BGO21_05650 [Dyadobacter sp. 50-39]|uniref:hypothetical protein n=1 Tax=Dyadobacter sp. 50-39 TaxID=1895756 RepID=UPI000969484F|nr:hypothetical protein [Dyadobacter sp. 50-39]OJV22639.1 MAG: hypothetical protein BGO21_05650 [Dyadobacter sp. 50-39]
MSDQEPVGKRMLGQLRDHTEPYRPDAWEDFEQFRVAKSRRRRIAFYWLAAASVVILFGTAVLTSHIIHRGQVVPHPLAYTKHQSHVNPGQAEPAPATDAAALNPIKTVTREKPAGSSKSQPRQQSYLTSRAANPQAGRPIVQTENKDITVNAKAVYSVADPEMLTPRPFSAPIIHFSQLYVRREAPQEEVAPQRARLAHWGIGVAQQTNRAAHTDAELNLGIGGHLLVPLSEQFSLVTGFSASKQSLNVRKSEQLAAAQGTAQLQRVRYHWFSTELPVHLRYKLIHSRKLGLTATAGISLQNSMGQQTDYTYKTRRTINTYSEGTGGPVLVSSQVIEESSSVRENENRDRWTFGMPLYLGIGLGYQWQGRTLEIEPYIKYPLGTVTAERLQLTSVGIQLRLSGAFKRRPGQ